MLYGAGSYTLVGWVSVGCCVGASALATRTAEKIFQSCFDGRPWVRRHDPVVSTDMLHNPASSIVDSLMTKVLDGNLLKILAWYDNEWGYSMRVVDLIEFVAGKGLN